MCGAALDLAFLSAGDDLLLFEFVCCLGDAAHEFAMIPGVVVASVKGLLQYLGKAATDKYSALQYRIEARDITSRIPEAERRFCKHIGVGAGVDVQPVTVAVKRR